MQSLVDICDRVYVYTLYM